MDSALFTFSMLIAIEHIKYTSCDAAFIFSSATVWGSCKNATGKSAKWQRLNDLANLI
jgi:hypothetical protein